MKLHQFRGTSALPAATDLGPVATGDNVGIEIELEGLKLFDRNTGGFKLFPPSGWTIHEDRSLRNDGAEFVFATPCGGREIWTRLTDLEAWFKEHKLKPIASNRTSVHVHIDASDVTTGEMLKWALIYTIYEPLLFSEFAPTRETSNFCVPTYNSVETRIVLGKLRGSELGFATPHWGKFYDAIVLQRENKRYGAMNLDAVRKFSTLEFRHLGGEWKSTPILDWVNVLLSLKKWAMDPNTSVKDIFHGPSRMYSDQMTYRIFEPRVASRFLFNRKFKELYFKGIRTAQEIYLQPDVPKIPEAIKTIIDQRKKDKAEKDLKRLREFIGACRSRDNVDEEELAYSTPDAYFDDLHDEFNDLPPEEELPEPSLRQAIEIERARLNSITSTSDIANSIRHSAATSTGMPVNSFSEWSTLSDMLLDQNALIPPRRR